MQGSVVYHYSSLSSSLLVYGSLAGPRTVSLTPFLPVSSPTARFTLYTTNSQNVTPAMTDSTMSEASGRLSEGGEGGQHHREGQGGQGGDREGMAGRAGIG